MLHTSSVSGEQHLKASLPGKVGGDCCQRDCHQVRGREQQSRHRAASLCRRDRGSDRTGKAELPDLGILGRWK